jgi:hypothetical protein
MIKRGLLSFALIAALAAPASASPVLVELFTSQGCSSCPPADDILAKLAGRDDVVALAFHVDYWDYIGWTDKLAIPEATARQKAYRAAFRNTQIYTPQMVIDGRVEFPGNDAAEVASAIARAKKIHPLGPDVAVARAAGAVTVSIPASAIHGAHVWYAVVAPAETAKVARGENRGRTLLSANPVRRLGDLGSYDGAAWSATIPGITADQSVAVWLQAPSLGAVAAAAMLPSLRN